MSTCGTRLPRREDEPLVTGRAAFTDDLTADLTDGRLADAAHVAFVRSPHAHARVLGVDVTAAARHPGVLAVVTAGDLTGLTGCSPTDGTPAAMSQPALADRVVRFVGEAVAAVVGRTRADAADAVELVDVDYDPLEALVDVAASARDETLLYPEVGTNTALETGDLIPSPDLFAGCDVVVTRRLVNQRVAPLPTEVRCAAVAPGADGDILVWMPTQRPHRARDELAAGLGLPVEDVRVVAPHVGGAFGARQELDPEPLVVAWLARRLDRPVRWVETRSENLLAMVHGRGQVQRVTIGGTRDGRVLAYRLDVLQDCGAHPRVGALLPGLTRLMAPGPYDIARVECAGRSVVTTTTPVGAYRGAGRPEATAAVERAMDLFADEIGADPLQVRRLNLVPAFTRPRTTSTGAVYDSGDYGGALDRVLAAVDLDRVRDEQEARRARRDAVRVGLGVSVYVEITGMALDAAGPCEDAEVRVTADGSVELLTGTSPQGQGHETALAMVVADEVGVPLDRVRVVHGDTGLVRSGRGTAGSRSIQLGGSAARRAGRDLVHRLLERGAEHLEVDPADLVLDGHRGRLHVRGAPRTGVTLADLVASAPLVAAARFVSGGPTYPFGAHAAVVEVDTETGRVVLRRLVAVDDAGTLVNPLLADGQRHGGLAQGVGQALCEEVAHDRAGTPLTSSLATYPYPTASDLPSFELLPMATPTDHNPLGAKGIGESGAVGATPAVQSAVVDAVRPFGVRHVDLPLAPHRVWSALREAGA